MNKSRALLCGLAAITSAGCAQTTYRADGRPYYPEPTPPVVSQPAERQEAYQSGRPAPYVMPPGASESSWKAPVFPPVRTIHERTMICREGDTMMAVARPDARERWGEINYMQLLIRGGCTEIGPQMLHHLTSFGPMMLVSNQASTATAFVMADQVEEVAR